ncbi:MAG: glycosyl transferase family 36 [Ignavibacteriaceae bacterium]|nr:glycosyl transferase family 36 [Ignavibacteriaceae bacterium]
MSIFETKYGYFSDDGNEYIIKTHHTPKPWVNVISNGSYGLVISQCGGGFSWLSHSEFNRLNRWHQDLIKDDWGKYFYIKNNLTNEIWSPTWMPVKTSLDFYQSRYGFGYTTFITEYKGIRIELTVFIPLNEEVEIWNFTIENLNNTNIDLSLFSYFEWCLGSSSDHHREFHKTFLETRFHPELNCLTATKRLWEIPLGDRGHWNIHYPYFGFIACTNSITDYDADKETFVGKYGSIQLPDGVLADNLARRTGKWNDSVAALKTNIISEPGEKSNLSFIIGIKNNLKSISNSISKFNSSEKVNKSLNDVKKYWENLLSTLKVETPDHALNLCVNKWIRYQAISARLWARTAYYQQSGAFGFRDQLQDSLVFLPIDPSFTADQIKLHARHQFKDGTVLHWWHPITETGLPTKMTDDLLWLPFILINYLDETGDFNILSVKEPYYDDLNKNDTLFNHSVAAIDRVLKRFSKRGLPLIGAGDWNDGLSAVGLDMKGESIWLAEFLYLLLIRFSEVCEIKGKKKLQHKYLQRAGKLRESFNKHAWDGNWFYRATKDNGEKIGSKKNKEGKIYLNAQTWSVISNITSEEKKLKAMKSVSKFLLRKNGTLLLWPAYTKPDKMIGYLSRYAPGRRENGGVYSHAATWSIIAYSILKQNVNTYEAFKRLCPIYNGLNPDEYQAEPFVMPGNIDGPDSPNYGMGGWTWYTGSAAWFQKVIVDWIVGVRATLKGIVIDPCVPSEWNSFSVLRKFRNSVYDIQFVRKNDKSEKAVQIFVDGKKLNGNILPIKKSKKIKVEVII